MPNPEAVDEVSDMADTRVAPNPEVADDAMDGTEAVGDAEDVARAGAPDAADPEEQGKYTGRSYNRTECDTQFLQRYGDRFVFQCIEMKEDVRGSVEFTNEHVVVKFFPEGYMQIDVPGARKHGNWRARSDCDCLIMEFRSVKDSMTKYPYTFLRVGPQAGTWISNKPGPYQAILVSQA